MKVHPSMRFPQLFLGLLALTFLSVPGTVLAQQNWQASVGAQSADKGHQALAFLPNEMWIHAGDSITWTQRTDEIHTVTFLTATQIVPPFQVGCPGFAKGAAAFDGSTCVSTPPLANGQTFTVTFPKAGNYKLMCLVHNPMNGAIHVLNSWEPLPHDQDYYNNVAAKQRSTLLASNPTMQMGTDGDHDMDDAFSVHVIAGVGEMLATPGGIQTGSKVRFLNGTIQIRAGETVEWGNFDPEEPHTITFGAEPKDLFDPSANVTLDPDGARHATITAVGESVHSGFIQRTQTDDPGVLPQNPLSVTRFRVTFTAPGVYDYKCSLHDNLGMVGRVIVQP